jgi:hypothetical protein
MNTNRNLTKEQIINYMVDSLGWSEDQDRLQTESRDDLWDMLTEEEKEECEKYSL